MLIERSAGHAEPYPMLLAYHFGGAREPISAARWLERAGDLAGEAHGQSEVMAQYEQALAAVDGCRSELLGGPEWGAWRSRLHEKLGDRLILSRGFDAAGEHYRQALGCIPIDTSAGEDRGTSRAATGEYIRRAELRRKEAVALDRAGNHDDALAAFAAAEAAGTERYGDESTLPAAVMAEIAVGRGRAYRGAGRGAEAEAAIRRALALLDGLAVCATLSRALSLRGQLAHERGEDKVAEQSYLDSLKIRERAGDQQGAAGCWYSLGTLAYDRGALPEAERCFERSLAIREALGDAWGSAFGWHKLGQIAQARASYGRAEECYRASLHIGERIGNQPGIADASFNLGQVARARADYAEAERCFRRSLAIQERLGDEAGVAASIGDIAEVARDRGELGQAESLARRSLATHERLHDQLGVATCLLNLGLIAAERGNYADALRDSRRARRLAHRIAAHRTECRAALAQAVSATQSGRHRLAAALLRAQRPGRQHTDRHAHPPVAGGGRPAAGSTGSGARGGPRGVPPRRQPVPTRRGARTAAAGPLRGGARAPQRSGTTASRSPRHLPRNRCQHRGCPDTEHPSAASGQRDRREGDERKRNGWTAAPPCCCARRGCDHGDGCGRQLGAYD